MVLLCLGILASLGASYRTENFVVDAQSPDVARAVGEAAEICRKKIARLWLEQELPNWDAPCMLEVRYAPEGRRAGYSTFYFDGGRVLSQHLHIQGDLPELLPKVLPHEVTHSILAHHFGCPLPRWADEGSAILSEDEAEKNRRDQQMLRILDSDQDAYTLADLFDLRRYPRDLRIFYTQSYSVTRYLVELADRKTFLTFLISGKRLGWEGAVRTHYPFDNLAQLERSWKKQLRWRFLRTAAVKALGSTLEYLQAEAHGWEKVSFALLHSMESAPPVPWIVSSVRMARPIPAEAHFAVTSGLPLPRLPMGVIGSSH